MKSSLSKKLCHFKTLDNFPYFQTVWKEVFSWPLCTCITHVLREMQIHLLMYCNLPLCWPKPPPSICKIIRVKVTAMTKKFRVLLCGGDVKGKPFFLNPAFSPLLLLLLSCSVCNLNLLLPNDLSNHPFLKKMQTGGLANFRRFFAISHNLSPCVGAKWFTYHPLSFLFSTPISKKVSKKDLLTQILLFLSNND